MANWPTDTSRTTERRRYCVSIPVGVILTTDDREWAMVATESAYNGSGQQAVLRDTETGVILYTVGG